MRVEIQRRARKYPHWKISRPYRGDPKGRYWGDGRMSFQMRSKIARMVKIPRIAVGRVRTIPCQHPHQIEI